MVHLAKVDIKKANKELEKSSLRWIRHDDTDEMSRLVEIDIDEQVKRFVEDVTGDVEDLIAFAQSDKNYMAVAVVGKDGHVGEGEKDKLQGWLSVYPDRKARLLRLGEVGKLMGRVLEVGFAKHPRAKSGQMASGLRQLVKFLKEEHDKKGEVVHLTAYIDPENEGSRRVLEAAGFVEKGKVKYRLKNKHHDHFFLIDWEKLK